MLRALAVVASLSLSLSPFASGALGAPGARESAEREAIERAVTDYVEALYQAKPELIERSVHPALEKLGLYRPDDSKEYRLPGVMTFEQLRALAGTWNPNGEQGSDLAYAVEVLDALDVTASAKLSAKWGVDYMHLVKSEGRWKIFQIVWQSHPPKD
jgi:hypothetical protein